MYWLPIHPLSLMFLSLGHDITSPSIIYMYMYNCISPSLSHSLSLSPSLSLSLSLSLYASSCMCTCLLPLFLLSVTSFHTCVLLSVKAHQLNKQVYAVVGSTFLEFCFGVKSNSWMSGHRVQVLVINLICMLVVTLPNQLTDFFALPYKVVHKCHVSNRSARP